MKKKFVLLLVALIAATAGFDAFAEQAAVAVKNPLTFDAANFTTVHVTVDGEPMELRRYKVVYVAKPAKLAAQQPARVGPPGGVGAATSSGAAQGRGMNDTVADATATDPNAYQSMFIYVPSAAYNDARTAIMLQVNNSGWLASPVRDRITEGSQFVGNSDTDNIGAALKAGYVIVSVGTRGRGIKAADDSWAGKSPAVVVDAKAAVRYLRLNDAIMPGSAERIVITGTSGGGGLSAAVAASGNAPDYYPYLAEIGAAGMDPNGKSRIHDDVFAAVVYCPIVDLGHADLAYEWQYGAVRTDANILRGQYPADMQSASAALAAAFPAYLASLHLKREDGMFLTAANLQDTILAFVKMGTEAGIARGETIPALGDDFILRIRNQTLKIRNDWLTVKNGKVRNIDYRKYLQFVSSATALKTAPAFDASANTGNNGVSGENTLFGSASVEYANFTEYSWNHNEVSGDGSGADDTGKNWAAYLDTADGKMLQKQIRMVNPMPYLNSSADSAPNWYVRFGMVDRDTSFAMEVLLYYAILGDPSVKDVSFKLAWLQPHAGNYDVREAYAWIAKVMAKAGDPTTRAGSLH